MAGLLFVGLFLLLFGVVFYFVFRTPKAKPQSVQYGSLTPLGNGYDVIRTSKRLTTRSTPRRAERKQDSYYADEGMHFMNPISPTYHSDWSGPVQDSSPSCDSDNNFDSGSSFDGGGGCDSGGSDGGGSFD